MFALFAFGTGVAAAHGDDARIFVEPAAVAPGGGIQVDGEEFDREIELEIRLDGVDVDASLGTVRTDLSGGFHVAIQVPSAVPPAVYAVVARGTDGHEINTNVVIDPAAGMGVDLSGDDLRVPLAIVFGVATILVVGGGYWARARRVKQRPIARG